MIRSSFSDLVKSRIADELHAPVAYAMGQPGKKLRSQLVFLGASFAGGGLPPAEIDRRCEVAASMIERIHAGSLIIDDIEDQSTVRRGAPSVHRRFGLARALNAGNWLYFDPLNSVSEMKLPAEEERQLFRECVRTLATAHYGQALDLGTAIDEVSQSEAPALCLSALDWKTGELTGLALQLGGFAAGASVATRQKLRGLGRSLGIGLQMLDDIANFTLDPAGPMGEKKYEDLKLRRPSWLWCFLATHLSPADYEEWRAVVRKLPECEPLENLASRLDIPGCARRAAREHFAQLRDGLREDFPGATEGWEKIETFIGKMEQHYEKS